jgi:nucleotide-binding universal stress UspA family protein
MLCHDGSQASIDALETISHGMMKNNDTLTCANVWSHEKEQKLDYRMKHENV